MTPINSSKVFKSLSQETRLEIVLHLYEYKEASCSEIAKHFSLSQPAFSHHTSKLIESKLINARKEGVYHLLSLNLDTFSMFGINLKKLLALSKKD